MVTHNNLGASFVLLQKIRSAKSFSNIWYCITNEGIEIIRVSSHFEWPFSEILLNDIKGPCIAARAPCLLRPPFAPCPLVAAAPYCAASAPRPAGAYSGAPLGLQWQPLGGHAPWRRANASSAATKGLARVEAEVRSGRTEGGCVELKPFGRFLVGFYTWGVGIDTRVPLPKPGFTARTRFETRFKKPLKIPKKSPKKLPEIPNDFNERSPQKPQWFRGYDDVGAVTTRHARAAASLPARTRCAARLPAAL